MTCPNLAALLRVHLFMSRNHGNAMKMSLRFGSFLLLNKCMTRELKVILLFHEPTKSI